MAAARNRTRAARRNLERQKRNALAVETAAEIAADRPKRRRARTKTVLEFLEQRGSITVEHRQAAERLEGDYRASMTNPANLVSRYEPNMPRPPKRYQAGADTPRSLVTRERYDDAMKAVGPWLSGIVMHVAICDQPVTEWGPLNGRAQSHGLPVLLVALDALCAHYGGRQAPAGLDQFTTIISSARV